MPPNSSPTFTPHTPTSLVQLLVYKPCSVSFILTPSYFVQEKKFLLYSYYSSAFCIASISSALNSPTSATQSCSSDSSDSSDSPFLYSPSVSFQIISTHHFSQS